MSKYNKYQIIATICIALFIINFSLCILVMDRHVYGWCYEDYVDTLMETYGENLGDKALSKFEAEQNYNQLADGFTKFFGNNYSDTSYEITKENIEKLNKLKGYYRLAWVVVVFSIVGIVYSYRELSRIRMYMPLLYGGILASVLTVLNAVIIMISHSDTLTGVRNMIIHGDYSYFGDMDLIRWILPPDYGMALAVAYLCIVFILIILAVLIRAIIIFCGRPHKF
ncbi:MAG: hypothetical protein K2G45_02315 [Lachnospiraceae bacterium]|nr:hypothetical protein [Lachnospiraceae bacterium]